jgi:hypothetical protein
VGYRFPGERGIVTLSAQNLFDSEFDFQDRDFKQDVISSPRFSRDLSVALRGVFRF